MMQQSSIDFGCEEGMRKGGFQGSFSTKCMMGVEVVGACSVQNRL
jgi:hypothetical protein